MEDLQIGVVSDVCGIEYGDEQVRVVADGCQIFVLFGGVAQGRVVEVAVVFRGFGTLGQGYVLFGADLLYALLDRLPVSGKTR